MTPRRPWHSFTASPVPAACIQAELLLPYLPSLSHIVLTRLRCHLTVTVFHSLFKKQSSNLQRYGPVKSSIARGRRLGLPQTSGCIGESFIRFPKNRAATCQRDGSAKSALPQGRPRGLSQTYGCVHRKSHHGLFPLPLPRHEGPSRHQGKAMVSDGRRGPTQSHSTGSSLRNGEERRAFQLAASYYERLRAVNDS